MNTQEKINRMKEFLKRISKKIASLFVIILAIGGGFVIGYYYNVLFTKNIETNQFKDIKVLENTSVAINEKNQLLIMDKKTGTFKIYEDSVGTIIFNIYANKMFIKQTMDDKK